MTSSSFRVSISLIIETLAPLEIISREMGVIPTNVFLKGTEFAPSHYRDKNIWVFGNERKECTNIGESLQQFIASIPSFSQRVSSAQQYGDCTIRLSIVSLWGKIGFSLSQNDLQELNMIGIPVDFSILSFGDCVDD